MRQRRDRCRRMRGRLDLRLAAGDIADVPRSLVLPLREHPRPEPEADLVLQVEQEIQLVLDLVEQVRHAIATFRDIELTVVEEARERFVGPQEIARRGGARTRVLAEVAGVVPSLAHVVADRGGGLQWRVGIVQVPRRMGPALRMRLDQIDIGALQVVVPLRVPEQAVEYPVADFERRRVRQARHRDVVGAAFVQRAEVCGQDFLPGDIRLVVGDERQPSGMDDGIVAGAPDFEPRP